MSNVRGMKTHGSYCSLFSMLNQASKRGSNDDSEILNSFAQQFAGTFSRTYIHRYIHTYIAK